MVVLKIGIYGFGAIGRLLYKYAISRGHEVVSVVDIDEKFLGKDAGEISGIGRQGVLVSSSLTGIEEADVVIHATGSYLDKVFDQIVSLVESGVNVVSTCETLAYPYYRYPVLSKRLDELSRGYGVVVIGTGINPGLLMDTLVVAVSSSLPSVKKIKVVRSLDAAKRREPFRRKIGVGEKPTIVKERLLKGELTGHVGFAESIYLIAQSGDLELSHVVEGQEPVEASEVVESSSIRVERGLNKGVIGYGVGYVGENELIRLEFHAYVGAPEYEEITVEGRDATVTWRSSGTPGDLGTVSMVLNVAEKVLYIPYGLRLMTELLPFRIKFEL
ncbi:MAG: dihydrodipicolinate reductase [Desulfurococcaceae archaeon]